MMVCAFCKAKYPENFKWCMEDGKALEKDVGQYLEEAGEAIARTVPCPECGHGLDPMAVYCGECGARLTPVEPQKSAGIICTECGEMIVDGDMFCGSCGARAEAGPPVAGALPAASKSAAGASCPNCGEPMVPGDTFCDSCGHRIGGEAALMPAPAAPPRPAGDARPAAFETGAECPNCGMTIESGATFCGTCGHDIGGAAPETPQAGYETPPAPPVEEAAREAGASCPNCGAGVTTEDDFCGTCGRQLKALEELPSIEAITVRLPVCRVCGMEGEEGDEFCGACGARMESAAALEAEAPPLAHAPEAPAETAAAGGGKLCTCCGAGNEPDAQFCSMCGVDFD